jgi:hypothetical protein
MTDQEAWCILYEDLTEEVMYGARALVLYFRMLGQIDDNLYRLLYGLEKDLYDRDHLLTNVPTHEFVPPPVER